MSTTSKQDSSVGPNVLRIDSIESLVKELLSSRDHLYCWRGQACSSWNLETSLSRSLPIPELLVNTVTGEEIGLWEEKALQVGAALSRISLSLRSAMAQDLELRTQYGALLEDAKIHSKREFDQLLQFGQHYGMKTPLLDVTESPNIALAFAVYDRLNGGEFKSDHLALWMIPAFAWIPEEDSQSSLHPYQGKTFDATVARTQGGHLIHRNATFFGSDFGNPGVTTVEIRNIVPTLRQSPRSSAQQAFLIRVFPDYPLDVAASEVSYKGKPLIEQFTRIEIPAEEKLLLDLAKWLKFCGVTQGTLFPDLNGRFRDINMIAIAPEAYGYRKPF